jgi:uncharacterized protein
MQKLFSWMNPTLEVRNTAKYGRGVFAKEAVVKGEMLAIFGGYVLTLAEEANLPEEYQDTGVQIAENFVLTSKIGIEDTDCFNHSCNPNAGWGGRYSLRL